MAARLRTLDSRRIQLIQNYLLTVLIPAFLLNRTVSSKQEIPNAVILQVKKNKCKPRGDKSSATAVHFPKLITKMGSRKEFIVTQKCA